MYVQNVSLNMYVQIDSGYRNKSMTPMSRYHIKVGEMGHQQRWLYLVYFLGGWTAEEREWDRRS